MIPDRSVKASLVLCALIASFAAAYLARPIVAPVTFALFIVAIVWPLQDALQRRLPKGVALILTLLVAIAVIGALGFLVVWAFSHVAQWLIGNTARFQALYAQAAGWLDGHGVAIESLTATSLSPASITGAVRGIGGQGAGALSFTIVTFAFTVLALLEVESVRDSIGRLENPGFRKALLSPAQEISAKFQQYMLVRTSMSLLTGAVVWVFALMAGMELALAWGVIAFVLNYIPFIGPTVATVFPTLFALAQFESWRLAIAIFAGLNAIQFFIGSYLEPRIAGEKLSLSPFMVLFAVFFGSFLWGIAGAFIGVPILIAVLTICDGHASTKWIAVLMSGGGKADPQPAPAPGVVAR
jgi:predicted PurR-regulated permease PerM